MGPNATKVARSFPQSQPCERQQGPARCCEGSPRLRPLGDSGSLLISIESPPLPEPRIRKRQKSGNRGGGLGRAAGGLVHCASDLQITLPKLPSHHEPGKRCPGAQRSSPRAGLKSREPQRRNRAAWSVFDFDRSWQQGERGGLLVSALRPTSTGPAILLVLLPESNDDTPYMARILTASPVCRPRPTLARGNLSHSRVLRSRLAVCEWLAESSRIKLCLCCKCNAQCPI